jgi:hypothetical protein
MVLVPEMLVPILKGTPSLGEIVEEAIPQCKMRRVERNGECLRQTE